MKHNDKQSRKAFTRWRLAIGGPRMAARLIDDWTWAMGEAEYYRRRGQYGMARDCLVWARNYRINARGVGWRLPA